VPENAAAGAASVQASVHARVADDNMAILPVANLVL
jgi:hypothetical protein